MNKKLQLKFLVFVCIIIVVIVYLYFNQNFSFGFSEDFKGLRDSVGLEIKELSKADIVENLKNNFKDLKDQMNEDEVDLESKITDNVLSKLSQRENIIYEYEPWGIKFSYDSLMSKDIDRDNEKILLFYEEVQTLKASIGRYVLEETFDDWLNNNYNLQKLDKLEYNGLIFWMQDLSKEENKLKEYYVNLDDNVFIIVLESSQDQEEYWKSLETIVKSFNIIKSNNL
jgi:hypothetical protein